MGLRALLSLLVAGSAKAAGHDEGPPSRLGGVLHDPETHVPRASSGCGKSSPYKPGKSITARGTYHGYTYTFIVYVPKAYDNTVPIPLILQHPGWTVSAYAEEAGAGITLYADSLQYISVTPQGANDNNNWGSWYSWNAAGTSGSPGPAGPTCTETGSHYYYCYESCKPCPKLQCDWTTCQDEVTPSGTGTQHVNGFIPSLYDTLESQLCIDVSREYAAGESNGGMFTYQLGVDLHARLAAVVPQFGSFAKGFTMAPASGVPILEFHGTKDTVVPGNVSLSNNGYFYTPTAQIFGGDAYSRGWKKANGCSGPSSHYPTPYDGIYSLYCVSEGQCAGGDVVRCAWNGGHTWFGHSAKYNGGLVTYFALQWTKPSHIGNGSSIGSERMPGNMLADFTIVSEEPLEPAPPALPAAVLHHGSHYGDPDKGCLPDEEIVCAGTGRVCAPKIHTDPPVGGDLPKPHCKVGGSRPRPLNGCPHDANVNVVSSRAWPVCLGDGNGTAPYSEDGFHCFLTCPCHSPDGNSDCGWWAHAHCPHGAFCELGELRARNTGVCTYHGEASVLATIQV